MAEQLAAMRGVGYGKWGIHKPGLYFETWLADDSATLQLLFGKDAIRLMAQADVGVADVSRLEGRSCRVDIDGYNVRFKGLVPIA
ncbi:MAG: hypothetical protein HY332_06460 [Chloroflexi bacterium]|nr:hypothetical protein [Chloroflexota bacterium]